MKQTNEIPAADAGQNITVYRKAKLWQIILVSASALNGMAIYVLINMASYSANIGYGISTALIGGLLTFTRIFDAVTDPMLAFLYDRMNTRFGKIRPLMLLGWAIQSIGVICMFHVFSSKGFGVLTFVLLYMLYVIGYTIVNMTAQTMAPLMTNDPKQRPMLGVWSTVFNYLVPMVMTVVLNMVLLPKFGGEYNQAFLSAAVFVVVAVSFVGVVLACIGIAEYDRPENFRGTHKSNQRLRMKDMWDALKNSRPLQCYIVSAASDKIAQQAQSASIVSTLMLGILIGNMGLGTMLSVISMLPSIVFAVVGAKYAGKHGNMETIVTWSRNCIIVNVITVVFFVIIDPSSIATMGLPMILYVLLSIVGSGFAMCVTMAGSAFMGDLVDYELDRSGRYMPAVISGTYSLIDKVLSSVSALIATGCVALIGYTDTLPQPGDPATTGVFWMAMFLRYGLAILGWICTLIAMRFCKLNKAEVAAMQKRISVKKAALMAEEQA